MLLLATATCFLLLTCGVVPSAAKPSLLLTAPKVLHAGTTETLVLTATEVPEEGVVAVRLLNPQERVLASSSVHTRGGAPEEIQLKIPNLASQNALLQADGRFGSYSIDKTVAIKVADVSKSFTIIVQTDKPIYKPGQLVQFRVLPISRKGLPLEKDTVGEVWVENPSNLRVSQWKNVSFSDGMVQLSMQLSAEPPFGQWKVKCKIMGRSGTRPFQVERYVLPKFEVEIVPPPFLMPENAGTTWKICAKYSYGKPVRGQLKAQITYQRFPWSRDADRTFPSVDHEVPINGCYEFEVDGRQLMVTEMPVTRRPLNVTAEVIEDGTGVTQNATKLVHFATSRLKLEFVNEVAVANVKPGLPYQGKLKVTLPDGTPAPGKKVKICFEVSEKWQAPVARGCRGLLSDVAGIIHFTVPAFRGDPQSELSLTLEATCPEEPSDAVSAHMSQPRAFLRLRPWASKSGGYVQLLTPEQPLTCDATSSVPIRYTSLDQHGDLPFHYQIISGSRIVDEGTFSPRPMQDTLPNEISIPSVGRTESSYHSSKVEFMVRREDVKSGRIRILLYYVHPVGEIIADTRQYKVKNCAQNKVSLSFAEESALPGTNVRLQLSAAPGSLCGISSVDKSVRLLKTGERLTRSKLEKALESLDTKPDVDKIKAGHCKGSFHPWFMEEESSSVDSSAAFEEVGMVVVTDLDIDVRKCTQRGWEVPLFRGMPGLPSFGDDAVMSLAFPMKGEGPAARFGPRTHARPVSETVSPKSAVDVRTHFPETWLWELHRVEGAEGVILSRELPHTVTEWEANAVCLSDTQGVGAPESPAIVRGFQPFFTQLTMPYAAVRGEELNLIVTIFNYFRQSCLPLKVSLEINPEEVKLLAKPARRICVCGGESVTLNFRIVPTLLGSTNLTVHAFSATGDNGPCPANATVDHRRARDSVRRSLLVKAEGLEREFSMSKYICVNENSEEPTGQTFFLVPSSGVVNDSARAFLSVSGDILSPTLASVEHLVRLPVGCGEQNLVLLAPNVFVLDYLTASEQLTANLQERLLHNIRTGYQRELNYRHPDGGYSAFGKMDGEPSLWLTAFVVRTFGGARRFITVDQGDFDSSVSWLLKQQYENGCFPSIGKVLNSKLKGGLKDQSLAPLTAYVLVSLLEAGTEARARFENAAHCLLAETPSDSYSLALSAYALALLEHPKAAEYLDALERRAHNLGEKMHWQDDGASTATAIETAGYAILAILKMRGVHAVSEVLPAVRWVLEQRNHNGGFVSTQDTVVALQALSEYAKHVSGTAKDLRINAWTEDGFNRSLRVHKDNCLLVQETRLPPPPSVLVVEASGKGCAFVQSTLRYNVHTTKDSTQFNLSVSVSQPNCQPQLTLCGRYVVPLSVSGMVTIEAKMVSGYIADTGSLENLLNSGQVKRYEVQQDQVNLYFDEMTSQETCVTFGLIREYVVDNTAPATVLLRDYYDPEEFVTGTYNIETCSQEEIPRAPLYGRGRLPFDFGRAGGQDGFPGFTDVDHELDFPNGVEGNVPVTVLAPPAVKEPFHGSHLCPACWDSAPEDFKTMYCKAETVLRAYVMNPGEHLVRVTHNVSPHLHRRLLVGYVVTHTLHRECTCSPLSTDPLSKKILLVLGGRNMVSSTGSRTLQLKLSSRTTIVQFDGEGAERMATENARKQCPP